MSGEIPARDLALADLTNQLASELETMSADGPLTEASAGSSPSAPPDGAIRFRAEFGHASPIEN